MTPAEYRTAIAKLGLSQRGAALFLGVNERTSRSWASGQSRVPVAVGLLLNLLIEKYHED
jgi:DNA-binding transcriptional regulator YiaG